MANFRNVTTGQVVSHEDDALAAWFKAQARWEETDEAPKKTTSRKTTSKSTTKTAAKSTTAKTVGQDEAKGEGDE